MNILVPIFIFLILLIIFLRVLEYFRERRTEAETAEPEQSPTPTPAASTTPAVPILKRIPWTAVGIVFLAIFILIIGYYANEGIKENRRILEETNAFRTENSIGVDVIEQGKDFITLKGRGDGGTVNLASEKISPLVSFNYSGGNSTFGVSFNGVYSEDEKHGNVFSFSDGIGKFSDSYKKEVDTKVKVEIVVGKDDTIKIWNYKIRRN